MQPSSTLFLSSPLSSQSEFITQTALEDAVDWCGRNISLVTQSIQQWLETTASVAEKIAQEIFFGLGVWTNDPNALAATFRKLDKHVITFLETLRGLPQHWDKVKQLLHACVGCIDTAQLAADISYYVNGQYKKQSTLNVAGKIAVTVADVAGAVTWLGAMGFINLQKAAMAIGEVRLFKIVPIAISSIPVLSEWKALQNVAMAIGNVRVFSVLTKISLGFVALRALDFAYAFFAADACRRLAAPGNSYQKTQAGLDLANNVAELALDALLLAGVMNVITIGVVGSLCIGTGIASFVYRHRFKQMLDMPLALPKPAAIEIK